MSNHLKLWLPQFISWNANDLQYADYDYINTYKNLLIPCKYKKSECKIGFGICSLIWIFKISSEMLERDLYT